MKARHLLETTHAVAAADAARNESSLALYDERFFEKRGTATVESAGALVPILIGLVEVRSIVDVGCGRGEWLRAFAEHGITDTLGIDGHSGSGTLLVPKDQFIQRDLRFPLRIDRTFDLALCLEVAEHLPAESGAVLVDSLTRLAPTVLFSAATPGQGGTGHINEQWPDYWSKLFEQHAYVVIDAIRPLIWSEGRIRKEYRQNALLFAREEIVATSETLMRARSATRMQQLSVVHPELFAKKANPSAKRLMRTLRQRVLAAARSGVRRVLPFPRGGKAVAKESGSRR